MTDSDISGAGAPDSQPAPRTSPGQVAQQPTPASSTSFDFNRPTIINLLFAAVLGAGLATGKPVIKLLLGQQIHLTDEGWRKLTVRWMMFFLALAAMNEIVWRNFSESTWVSFKVFGILPLTIAFAAMQIGLLKRHQISE